MKTWTFDRRPSLTNPINQGDEVLFNVGGRLFRYYVDTDHLRTDSDNRRIFKVLGLKDAETNDLATYSYGYMVRGGVNALSWPESKENDFNALTRLVNTIYNIITHDEQRKKKPYTYEMASKEIIKQILDKNLKLGDIVTFHLDNDEIKYEVQNNHLKEVGEGNNSRIFTKLGLSGLDKEKWAQMAYGYRPNSGGWPETKTNDFQALTRLVDQIKKVTEEVDSMLDEEGYDWDEIDVWEIIDDINKLHKETPESKIDKSSINQNTLQNGRIIKTTIVTPAVVRGEKRTGCTIRGKESRTTTEFGHLSHRKIFG